MNSRNSFKILLLFLKPKIVIVGIICLFLIFAFSMAMGIGTLEDNQNYISEEDLKTYYVNCSEGKVNHEKFYKMFDDAGVFTDMGSVFIQLANKNKIDPVLLAAIAFHETGKGTSKAVKEKNNPGGLMNPNTGRLFEFPTLTDGIDAMASNLFRNYISLGLVTITQIGQKYAPVGANNDPNNLNLHWIPSVTNFANEFGGLTMNCSVVQSGSGEFFKPVPNAIITSNFGWRSDPFTGELSFHKGVDFDCETGQPIYAALGGKIVVSVKSGYGSGYGHHVVIQHQDKYTLYAHMTDVFYDVGQHVEQGQPIGSCGSTGNSTGSHLHFEVQLSLYGERIDPMPYFGN